MKNKNTETDIHSSPPEKKKAKKVLISVLSVILAFAVAVGSAFALVAYSLDEDTVLASFISQYGWDSAKMKAYEWIGIDGNTYHRQSEYEKEMYEDLYKTNEDLAVSLGLISRIPATGGNAASMIALAIHEWEEGVCETPMGSNNVKYNTWYYGRVVQDPPGESVYPWCCAFISWLADQCGLIESGTFTKTAGCSVMRTHFINKGYEYWGIRSCKQFGGTETPIPGDIIIWGNTSHIGLIVAVNDTSIETIEGNAGDKVSHNTYTIGSLTGDFGISEVFRVQYPDNETTLFNFLVSVMGLNPAGAIGILANISCESNFNEQSLGDGGTSYGICQWHLGRWDRLQSFCNSNGMDWQTIDGQMYYLQYELENYYTGVLSKIRTVGNSSQGAYDAAFAWCHDFEVPQGYEFTTSNYRGNLARSTFWPKYEEAGMTQT